MERSNSKKKKSPVYRYVAKPADEQWNWPSEEQIRKSNAIVDDVEKAFPDIYESNYAIGHNILFFFKRFLTVSEEKILDDIVVVKYRTIKTNMKYP